jgi:predicted RNA-binding Zn-ribbon protein involved in translation (DUF1610 family)
MSYDSLEFDEPGDELRDDEYPDESYSDGDSSDDAIICPECGTEVYEDAEMCPVCGNFITRRQTVWSNRPLLWILLGFVGIVAAVIALCAAFI